MQTLAIINRGSAVLQLGTVQAPPGFIALGHTVGVLAAGEMTTFQLMLDTTSSGPKSGRVTLSNSDSKKPSFTFEVSGTVTAIDLAILNTRLNGFDISPHTDADCDVNGDGHVTTADRVRLNKIRNGLAVP